MSLEAAQRTASPAITSSSGRNSPAPVIKPPRQQLEDDPKTSDKSQRRYAAGIERSLSLFDAARLEWPDYISFLGRLLKAIQSHSGPVTSLPHKHAVASRLSQCLNPALPSGVHQKAIDVYVHIFTLIGKQGLSEDLQVYLPGLAPVLSFASLSIRPLYLALLEDHVITAESSALRPATRALLVGLFPGLDEESSEDFDRVFNLIESLHRSVSIPAEEDADAELTGGDEYFWQCLFLVAISSPARRVGALAYLSRCLPRFTAQGGTENGAGETAQKELDSQLSREANLVITPEPGLLIRCFCCGLEDKNALVQRGFLDLLVSHIPLDSPVLLRRTNDVDLKRLFTAALAVLSRRDMSLNRRLWSWLLGPDVQSANFGIKSPINETPGPGNYLAPAQSTYFGRFAKGPLVNSLTSLIQRDGRTSSERAHPYRITLALMDRIEIGGSVVPFVFQPAMFKLLQYQQTCNEAEFQEVLKSANGFFDGIESGMIWSQISSLINSAFDQESDSFHRRKENLRLVKFLLNHFNVRDEEMLTFHIPSVCAMATALLVTSYSSGTAILDASSYQLSFEIVEKLISLMPERASLNDSFSGNHDIMNKDSTFVETQTTVSNAIEEFYTNHLGNLSVSPPPFSSRQIAKILLTNVLVLFCNTLKQDVDNSDVLQKASNIACILLAKIPDEEISNHDETMHNVLSTIENCLLSKISESCFQKVLASSVMLVSISANTKVTYDYSELDRMVRISFHRFWPFLDVSTPRYHVETVRSLWALDEITHEKQVLQATICEFLAPIANGLRSEAESITETQRFGILWMHTMQGYVPTARKTSNWSFRPNAPVRSQTGQDSTSRLASLKRPILLVMDVFQDVDSPIIPMLASWFDSAPLLRQALQVLLDELEPNISRVQQRKAVESNTTSRRTLAANANELPQAAYILRSLQALASQDLRALAEVLQSQPSGGSLPTTEDKDAEPDTFETRFSKLCLAVLDLPITSGGPQNMLLIKSNALSILKLFLQKSSDPHVLVKLHLEQRLMQLLTENIDHGQGDTAFQIIVLDSLSIVVNLRNKPSFPSRPKSHQRHSSLDGFHRPTSRNSATTAQDEKQGLAPDKNLALGKEFLECLRKGMSSTTSLLVLNRWIAFVIESRSLLQELVSTSLIEVVEFFCNRIHSDFSKLRRCFEQESSVVRDVSESTLLSLVDGLEQIFIVAHDKVLLDLEAHASAKTPDQPSTLFGGSGQAQTFQDSQKARSIIANSKLSFVLSVQDALRASFAIWFWEASTDNTKQQDLSPSASFGYVSSKLRSRLRKFLDRTFATQILESLEVLINVWAQGQYASRDFGKSNQSTYAEITLLHILNSTRPKIVMPALFNSIYSRTNPTALDPTLTSSLTAEIPTADLGAFLIEYVSSIEDDEMDDIWPDCMTFLRDILANPFPHSKILPLLITFLILLAEKLENANFGEQRRMKKELGEHFSRLLAATLTVRSTTAVQDILSTDTKGREASKRKGDQASAGRVREKGIIQILVASIPKMPIVTPDTDRLIGGSTAIATSVVGPVVHSRSFPEQMPQDFLRLCYELTRLPQTSKAWKREIGEVCNHSRLFTIRPLSLIEEQLLPLLQSWIHSEKDIFTEMISKVQAPTTAGIVFGVGASAARVDADKKAQLNLKRCALLALADDSQSLLAALRLLEEKVVELVGSTTSTSPSSNTRAEVFMLLRALILKVPSARLSSFWPLISSELLHALGSAFPTPPGSFAEKYNSAALLQACKLLDVLVLLAPDDFQMYEWLFVIDSIDAVYRPPAESGWEPVALVDELSEELGAKVATLTPFSPHTRSVSWGGLSDANQGEKLVGTFFKSPLLKVAAADVSELSKDDLIKKVLRPFFSQLSIHSFESSYGMGEFDMAGARRSLLQDLFDVKNGTN